MKILTEAVVEITNLPNSDLNAQSRLIFEFEKEWNEDLIMDYNKYLDGMLKKVDCLCAFNGGASNSARNCYFVSMDFSNTNTDPFSF